MKSPLHVLHLEDDCVLKDWLAITDAMAHIGAVTKALSTSVREARSTNRNPQAWCETQPATRKPKVSKAGDCHQILVWA